jgi:aquaporin Z
MTVVEAINPARSALAVVRDHWRFYLIEAALLGLFMISACAFCMLLEHPGSPLRQHIDSRFVRRMLMGIAMGGTAIALIYSRWGRRSGAHMNPATTVAFLRLRRIHTVDAIFYIAAQFIGGALGVLLMTSILSERVMHPNVNYAATLPGKYGLLAAWMAEFVIAFVMLTMVLNVNRFPSLARYTGIFVGMLVATYITFEAPISGMSLNPARTFASAVNAKLWSFLWLYFTAPVAGMLAAVEVSRLLASRPERLCGKFSHSRTVQCIFQCKCLEKA